jgi:hypothetical protein
VNDSVLEVKDLIGNIDAQRRFLGVEALTARR